MKHHEKSAWLIGMFVVLIVNGLVTHVISAEATTEESLSGNGRFKPIGIHHESEYIKVKSAATCGPECHHILLCHSAVIHAVWQFQRCSWGQRTPHGVSRRVLVDRTHWK